MSLGAGGYIWTYPVKLPGFPFPVRVPVLVADHPPSGIEAEYFTYYENSGSLWDEARASFTVQRSMVRELVHLFNKIEGIEYEGGSPP